VVPVGPPLIWIGAALWLFQQGDAGWAIFVVLWGFFVVSMVDNIIKPLIISRGSSLPFVLVFLGVLGGVVAFGLIGVFLGPTLLAVGYRLLSEWSDSMRAPQNVQGHRSGRRSTAASQPRLIGDSAVRQIPRHVHVAQRAGILARKQLHAVFCDEVSRTRVAIQCAQGIPERCRKPYGMPALPGHSRRHDPVSTLQGACHGFDRGGCNEGHVRQGNHPAGGIGRRGDGGGQAGAHAASGRLGAQHA
jgi:hypothetical protein